LPKILHQQQGLKIVQNDRNGFVVCTLHYTADPRKRGEKWMKEASQGLSKAKFEQEYEISYDAMQGERVFPEILSRRGEIIISEGPFLDNVWPRDLPMWGGFDYGSLNPSSFHVYTLFDGVIYVIWELYEPCKNIILFAEKMKKCEYWDQLKYIAADPDIFNLKMRDMRSGLMVSVADNFRTLGITKLLPGNHDEAAWITKMQKHLQATNVTFKIFANCFKMIEEFEMATYVTMSERQLETQNYREAMVDRHNHSLDDCKYFINSVNGLKSRKVSLPNLIGSYCPENTSGLGDLSSTRRKEVW
jgi:hypothetical protein